MRKFDLGSGTLVDFQTLIDTRLLVQANSGGGKSWCLRRILESTFGLAQHLVIDLEGEFATLRDRFDYVIAAREGGDTVAHPRSAKLLAERLLELGASAILDIYELQAPDRIRFVRNFIGALIDAPKKFWHPALVVVDEAHVFCPQVGEAESAGAVIDLATRGRKRGFCAVLATQRLSKLHKDAAAECNNVLIGRTGLDVDVKRAADVLGLSTKEATQQLRSIAPGSFFAFGPAFDAGVNRIGVGPVVTEHPKAGSRAAFSAPPPTAKIRSLLPRLADIPAEQEKREKTIEDLRAENAQLRQAAARAAESSPPVRPAPPLLTDLDRSLLASVTSTAAKGTETFGSLRPLLEHATSALNKAAEVFQSVRSAVDVLMARVDAPGASIPPAGVYPAPLVRTHATLGNSAPPKIFDGLTAPRQRILDSLEWLRSVRVAGADRTQLALLSDASPKSSAYANNLGALRSAGLVEYGPEGTVYLTDTGRRSANPATSNRSSLDVHRSVLERVSRPKAAILSPLIAAYPKEMSRSDLAKAAGASETSSAFANNLGSLRSLGVITYRPNRGVQAAEILFVEGR